jgi:hypothetical protein
VTEDEIEIVAEELAKAGGLSWYPGRERGCLLRVVSDRYREQAQLAIAALNRFRAQEAGAPSKDAVQDELRSAHTQATAAPCSTIQPGATVVYRPPGEQRAYPCRVERIEGGQAYLVPHLRAWTGWVPRENLSLVPSEEDSFGSGAIKAIPVLHHESDTARRLDPASAPYIVAQENSPYSLRGGLSMTDDEVEVVAAELAKAGGVSWHSGQERGPLKLVMKRYRDRARLAIAALERVRAAKQTISLNSNKGEQLEPDARATLASVLGDAVSVGSLVLYRPPGDKRSYPCRVEKADASRVYLVPEIPSCTGWVDLDNIPSPAMQ